MLLAEVLEMESNLNREANMNRTSWFKQDRARRKTAKRLRNTYDIYVITNDIYTKEDQP